jgi:phosphoserine phosphatase RsbU/P
VSETPDDPPVPTEQLFDDAPCGWVLTDSAGVIVKANRVFRSWTGFTEAVLSGGRRFQDLLAPGGQIYYQTHLEPMLRIAGSVSQVALEIVRADGSRMPALVNSVLRRDDAGQAYEISTMIFDASDRRRYEQGLLEGQAREREIAQELQRSMVSGVMPATPSFLIDVVYSPAVAGLAVGGDWYDAFWLDDAQSTVALVVGDVVGRGLAAAITMAQLRPAVRALATTGLGPAAVLEALDLYVSRYQSGKASTAVYAQIDLVTLEMRFACAGHPPPVVIDPDGEVCCDWAGRSTPLDTYRSSDSRRPEGTRQLTAGSTLLLYTDGLIERRSNPEEDGLQRLIETITAQGTRVAGVALGRAVARALHDPDQSDDICLLAIELNSTKT